MTRYLLDTDSLIDFSKGVEPATSLILGWIDGSDTVAVCPITVAEFFAGLTGEQALRWEPFVAALDYWDISVNASMRAGQAWYMLTLEGRAITTTDALLAALARVRRATLVTGNVKDFPMADVSLLPLR